MTAIVLIKIHIGEREGGGRQTDRQAERHPQGQRQRETDRQEYTKTTKDFIRD